MSPLSSTTFTFHIFLFTCFICLVQKDKRQQQKKKRDHFTVAIRSSALQIISPGHWFMQMHQPVYKQLWPAWKGCCPPVRRSLVQSLSSSVHMLTIPTTALLHDRLCALCRSTVCGWMIHSARLYKCSPCTIVIPFIILFFLAVPMPR